MRTRKTLALILVLALQIGLGGCTVPANDMTRAPVETSTPAATSSPVAAAPHRGGTLVVSFGVGEPRHFNPSGLHVIGLTREGRVFRDSSGQFRAGMDISLLLDVEGKPVVPVLLQAADSGGTEPVRLERFLPHPVTHSVAPLSLWCGRSAPREIVCALGWDVTGVVP